MVCLGRGGLAEVSPLIERQCYRRVNRIRKLPILVPYADIIYYYSLLIMGRAGQL